MRRSALAPVRMHRRVVALRAALAASLVLGLAAALPALPALAATEPVHTDATGFLELPAPAASGADYAFDFLTCPDAPPNQGVDAWVYDLDSHAAAGAPVTISGEDAAGPTDLAVHVYKADCTWDRVETSSAALTFVLEEGDRHLAATTPSGMGTSLLLEVGAAPVSDPTTDPTTDPDPGGDTASDVVMTRSAYPTINDELYAEESTDAASLEFQGQWGMRVIRAHQAWQEERATGAGIRVAVLDSGLDVAHEDFQCPGKIARLDPVKYERFKDVTDTDGHGTHVAGIVGACTNNGTGVVGVAPDATILPIQALSPEEATAERLAAAIDAAVESGAHVINMSLGFGIAGTPGTGSALALLGAFAEDVDPAIDRAVQAGVVVVAAAGNESVPICGYPALAADVVCVGSTDRRDLNSWYGNFPTTPSGVSVVAPGGSGTAGLVFCDAASEGVLSTYSTDATECPTYPGYSTIDGTSMASPHVAGVAALVYDRLGGEHSPANAEAVKQALVAGAVDLYSPGYDPVSGDGRVDALGAVLSVTPAAADSELELAAPQTAQTTDDLPLQARLSEGEGSPIAGAEVRFVLTGQDQTRSVTATTGADGVAEAELPLDVAPGSYELTATYAGGNGASSAAQDGQALEVVRDDSALTLTADGVPGQRSLQLALTDADSSTGIGGATVVLLADGREMGTVTTDAEGRASFTPQGRDRNAQAYEARFAGDGSYEPSAATATG